MDFDIVSDLVFRIVCFILAIRLSLGVCGKSLIPMLTIVEDPGLFKRIDSLLDLFHAKWYRVLLKGRLQLHRVIDDLS